MTRIAVVDVGTTSMRAALVDETGRIIDMARRHTPPQVPFPGLVEFDPVAMGDAAVEMVAALVGEHGAVDAVGISNQRASTVIWDAGNGEPIHPGLGWQDLRTIGLCLTVAAEHGASFAPNQSATKIGWLLDTVEGARSRDLRIGTVDSWLAWRLTGGAVHVTDHTNAGTTGLLAVDGRDWAPSALEIFGIEPAWMPRLVDTAGPIAEATAIPGAPPLTALVGDQQASLVGQGCVVPGRAKVTFGSGGMLDICTGATGPAYARRGEHGTYPIVAWSHRGSLTWGVEAIMLSAGTNVEWLVEDLGLLGEPAESEAVAGSVPDTDGVVYVPALAGLGTPRWDFGARGTLLGITRGTTRAHLVRAVLEGVAQRGADLVEAAEADSGLGIPTLRIDGGMSANRVFAQALADAAGKPVEVAPVVEATAVGAGLLAAVGAGAIGEIADADALFTPRHVVEPAAGEPAIDRSRWAEAVDRAAGWFPELSAIDF